MTEDQKFKVIDACLYGSFFFMALAVVFYVVRQAIS